MAVRVGRRDGSPPPGATGREVAAPLLFRRFGLLPAEPPIIGAATVAAIASLAPVLSRTTPHAWLLIVFPPSNVDLAFDPASPIDLRARGGTPPHAWTSESLSWRSVVADHRLAGRIAGRARRAQVVVMTGPGGRSPIHIRVIPRIDRRLVALHVRTIPVRHVGWLLDQRLQSLFRRGIA